MKRWSRLLFVTSIILLLTGCTGSLRDPTSTQIPNGQPGGISEELLNCPQPDGNGSVPPAISISSIVFLVNGSEVLVRDGDGLRVQPGDVVRVEDVTICVGAFSGNGGEACVDIAPVADDGHEVASEHQGSHMFNPIPGRMSISGLDFEWVIEEGWGSLSAVLNHWAPTTTDDTACAGGLCERDDWMIIEFH